VSLWHWLLVHLSQESGTSSSSSRAYNFFSGFGSDLGEVTLLAAAYGLYRAHNCHTRHCWRLAKHPVVGTAYKVCRRCHPTVPDKAPTREQIQANHQEAPVDVEIEVEEENPFAHGSEGHLLFEIHRELKRIGAVVRKIADVIAPTPSVTITLVPGAVTHKP
jgi:hypothetical protein